MSERKNPPAAVYGPLTLLVGFAILAMSVRGRVADTSFGREPAVVLGVLVILLGVVIVLEGIRDAADGAAPPGVSAAATALGGVVFLGFASFPLLLSVKRWRAGEGSLTWTVAAVAFLGFFVLMAALSIRERSKRQGPH